MGSTSSCASANEVQDEGVEFKFGYIKNVDGKFLVVDELSIIKKSDVMSGGAGFGVTFRANCDFGFLAEITFPKANFSGENVSVIRIDDDDVSVKMRRRTKGGYGYVFIQLNEDDPYGNYKVKIYVDDSLVFVREFEVVSGN